MFEEKEISGYLNLFLLHDENEDISPRQWIRTPTNTFQLKFAVRGILADLMKKLKAGKWRVYEEMANQIKMQTGYKPSLSSINAWVDGVYSTPLIFLRCLLEYHTGTLECDGKEEFLLPLLERMSSGCRNSWFLVKIPNVLTTSLAYFLGIITGDGSLPNVKDKKGSRIYEIKLEGTDLEFFEARYCPLVLKLFGKWPRLSKRTRLDGRVTWQAVIGAKPIFRMLTRLFDMPIGRKYEIVRMPPLVKNSDPKIWASYIRGLFDTDGSISGGSRIALYSKSQRLLEDVGDCLHKLAIDCEFYEYAKREAPEFQLYVGKDSRKDFINSIGSAHPTKQKRLMELAM